MAKFTVRPPRVQTVYGANTVASSLLIAALIVGFLYAGRDIIVPLVIAGLLAFMLSPLIMRLRGLGLGRVLSVVASVAFAVAVLALLSWTIIMQMSQLTEVLPKFEANLSTKIHAINGGGFTSTALEKASGALKNLQSEINKPSDGSQKSDLRNPMPVQIEQPPLSGLESVANVVRTLLAPVANVGLTLLFLVFILLQREDLRDRFLRLAGTADLQRSTEALDDAATRLSKLFLLQTAVNAGFGLVIGIGLSVIGIPNAPLWGILSALLRYVPFIGAIIAALIPIALAAAVDPGWLMVVEVVALFGITEAIVGNGVEPMLYGQHTGLSPVAIIIAAMFWALLWGPVGLLLATPLTICLVVIGRHIDAFSFMEILLGDTPALQPFEGLYQRLLSGNAIEAADEAAMQAATMPLVAYYDAIPMKALALAQRDAAEGKLTLEKQNVVRDMIAHVVEELSDSDSGDVPAATPAGSPSAPPGQDQAVPSKPRILCVACRSPLDEAAAMILAHLLSNSGLSAVVQPFSEDVPVGPPHLIESHPTVVCLSYFGANANPAHVRYTIRRLKRVLPDTKFLACYWSLGDDSKKIDDWRVAAGAQRSAGSLAQAIAVCSDMAGLEVAASAASQKSLPMTSSSANSEAMGIGGVLNSVVQG